MDIDVITQYILSLAPAFTAVVGMIVTLGVGICKIKKASQSTVDEVKENSKGLRRVNEELKCDLINVHKENAELKKEMSKLMAKIEHIHFVDDEEV